MGSGSTATLTGRAAIVLLVLAVLAVSYASSVRAWLNQRSEINAMNAEISEQQAAVAELEQTKRRWQDPAYLEAQARLRFSLVMPGETGYGVIDEDGSVLSDGGGLSEPVGERESTEQPEWWETAWGSVVEAGVDPVAADAAKPTKSKRTPLERIGDSRRDPAKSQLRPENRLDREAVPYQ
ncbi:MAG: septum formation initiator family protein [Nocardioidaceae bacterium]